MASVHTRTLRDGSTVFRVHYRLGDRQCTKTFPDLKSAEKHRRLIETIGAAAATRHIEDVTALEAPEPEVLTVAAWVERHITALTGVTEGTRGDYRSYLRNDIAPTLGDIPLTALTREAVAGWVNELVSSGAAGKTIKNKHSLLSGALTEAVRAGHCPTNHAKGVRLPSAKRRQQDMVLLTDLEQNDFLSCFKPKYRPVVAALLLTGVRWGELTALQVKHVDTAARAVRIEQAWKHTDGGPPLLGDPKTARGFRTIGLDGDALALFADAVAGKGAQEWVFAAPRGGPFRHYRFWEDVWSPAVSLFAGDYCDAATQKKVRGQGKRPKIHDLRHTHASKLIAMGIQPMYIQRRLGHESISTTMDVYGHLVDEARDAMAAAVSTGFAHLTISAPKALPASAPKELEP